MMLRDIFYSLFFFFAVVATQAAELTSPPPPSLQHKIAYGEYVPPELTKDYLQKILGKEKISRFEKLFGGLSKAKLYQVDTNVRSYVVRNIGGFFSKPGIPQEIAIMKAASALGVSPHLYHSDEAHGTIFMEKIDNILPPLFAPGFLYSQPDLMKEIARLLRLTHNIKPDPKIVTKRYWDYYLQESAKVVDLKPLSKEDAAIFKKFATKEYPRGKEVICHNDFHGRNILYDGKKVYLVDWEMSGFGPEFYDVAQFANFQTLTNDEGKAFLDLYLERPAKKEEYEQFVAMRQLEAMMKVSFQLQYGKPVKKFRFANLYTKDPHLTMRNFFLAIDSKQLETENAEHVFELALATLKFVNYLK